MSDSDRSSSAKSYTFLEEFEEGDVQPEEVQPTSLDNSSPEKDRSEDKDEEDKQQQTPLHTFNSVEGPSTSHGFYVHVDVGIEELTRLLNEEINRQSHLPRPKLARKCISMETFINGCGDTGETREERINKYWYYVHANSEDSWESSPRSEGEIEVPFTLEEYVAFSPSASEVDIIDPPAPDLFPTEMVSSEQPREEEGSQFSCIVASFVNACRALRRKIRNAFKRRSEVHDSSFSSPPLQEGPHAFSPEATRRNSEGEAGPTNVVEAEAEEARSTENQGTRWLRLPKFKILKKTNQVRPL